MTSGTIYFIMTFVVVTLAVRYVGPLIGAAAHSLGAGQVIFGFVIALIGWLLGREMKGHPKVELHLHLEGARTARLHSAGWRRKSTSILSGIFRADGSLRLPRFPAFLQVYEAATSVLSTPED